jgi:hypothetical protein
MTFQLILPRKPKEILNSHARSHMQPSALATQPGPELKSVLERVRRLRRALPVLQQPARGGEPPKLARPQPHEQIDEDIVRQLQQKRIGSKRAASFLFFLTFFFLSFLFLLLFLSDGFLFSTRPSRNPRSLPPPDP